MAQVLSVNVGTPKPLGAKSGSSSIDKEPLAGRVRVLAPGPHGAGTSGVQGDSVSDTANHGGDLQAVHAYAREDLDWWQQELEEPLRSGVFGENLTTLGLDVTGALIGEQWRIGNQVLLQVTVPRIPCVTFATWMRRPRWVRTFTQRGVPGAYLRVLEPGEVQAGDPISIEFRPTHHVNIGMLFRAVTLEPDLLAGVLEAEAYLPEDVILRARRRQPFEL